MYALQIVPCMHSYLYRKLSKIVSTLWLCKAAYMHVCIYTTLYIIVWETYSVQLGFNDVAF